MKYDLDHNMEMHSK